MDPSNSDDPAMHAHVRVTSAASASREPVPHKKLEDTADGCRSLAQDDRTRAEESDSDRMRFRLACSAEAWTARADLLDRLEANRARTEAGLSATTPVADTKEKDHG